MTYTEVKNQFTTIESINTRLEEIFKIYDEYDVKANEVNDKHFDLIKKFISDNLASDYELTSLTSSSMELTVLNETFYHIDFYFGYDIKDWNNPNVESWKFEMNISSCGNFSVNNTDEKSIKVFNYYNTIASILSNEKFRIDLEKIVKTYVDETRAMRKSIREIHSEEQQLIILKKNLEKEENSKNFIEATKNAKDNTMVVIVNKGELDANAIGTHRGTPITIESLPEPNVNWKELDKKCKLMNKMNSSKKYIATQIRFIKFNK